MTDDELKHILATRFMAIKVGRQLVEKGLAENADTSRALAFSIQAAVLSTVMVSKLNKGVTKEFIHAMLDASWDLVEDLIRELDMLDEINAKTTAKMLAGMWNTKEGSA